MKSIFGLLKDSGTLSNLDMFHEDAGSIGVVQTTGFRFGKFTKILINGHEWYSDRFKFLTLKRVL